MYDRYMPMSTRGRNVHDRFTSGWPQAVVFDCDGILVDSQDFWDAAFVRIARAAGTEIDLSELHLAGASAAQAAIVLSDVVGATVTPPTIEEALLRGIRSAIALPEPGARCVTDALVRHTRLAVASNGPAAVIDELLRLTDLRKRFETIVSADEVSRSKPAPDVYLEACRRLSVHPFDAVAIEDSARGAEAARVAGLVVIGVPSHGERFDADLIVDRLDRTELIRFLCSGRTGRRP